MGFDRAAQHDCLGCVASILALGNLEFEQIPGARDDEQQVNLLKVPLTALFPAPLVSLTVPLSVYRQKQSQKNHIIIITHCMRQSMLKAMCATTS